MTLLKKFLYWLKENTKSFKDNYLNGPLKIIEFVFVETFYIALAVILTNRMISNDLIQIIGQFQVFSALYLAFRFRYFGLSIALFINLMEAGYLLKSYLADPNLSLMAGLTAKLLTIVSSVIVAFLSNSQETQKRELQAQKAKLELLAVTDDLTDVYNQRFFNTALESEIQNGTAKQECVGLIVIDIDNFKMCNDIYGHDYGDSVLRGTASILKEAAGKENIVCRYGGDEFSVILPGSNLQSTSQVAHSIRNSFERLKSNYFKASSYKKITLSMGLSVYPDMAGNKDDLISQADMALYHSKNLGKNNIHFYQDVLLKLRKSISSDHQHMIGVFRGLLSTISAKDKYTLAHSERVSVYAVMIGKALDLDLKDISTLQYAGLLHDIGKIEIPKLVLSKIGNLSDDELSIIKQHPLYSANILEPLGGMNQLIDYVVHHHERYDGQGYPDGLTGKAISLGARVLCVADSFDAMLSDRPYSKSMAIEEAFHELEQHAGSQFDPEIVKIFINVMKKSENCRNIV